MGFVKIYLDLNFKKLLDSSGPFGPLLARSDHSGEDASFWNNPMVMICTSVNALTLLETILYQFGQIWATRNALMQLKTILCKFGPGVNILAWNNKLFPKGNFQDQKLFPCIFCHYLKIAGHLLLWHLLLDYGQLGWAFPLQCLGSSLARNFLFVL